VKVAQLARLLDSLVDGLDGTVTASLTSDFRRFREAMEPFSDASVAEFTSFLSQFGAEFRQTGKISSQGKITLQKSAKTPKPDGAVQVASAVASVEGLLAEIDRGSVNDYRVQQVLDPLSKLTVSQLHEVLTCLRIAERPRAKSKIVEKIRQVIRHQMESSATAASVGGRAAT
jgi:hypothetical protein